MQSDFIELDTFELEGAGLLVLAACSKCRRRQTIPKSSFALGTAKCDCDRVPDEFIPIESTPRKRMR